MARSQKTSSRRWWRKNRLAVLIAGGVLLLAGGFLLLRMASTGSTPTEPGTEIAADEAEAQEPAFQARRDYRDAKALLEDHYTAVGGRTAWREVKSMLITGTYTTADGKPLDLQVIKKQPSSIRITMQQGDYDNVIVFDGKKAWQAVMRDSLAYRLVDLPEADLVTLRQDSELVNYLFTYTEHGYRIGEPTLETRDGTKCYRLEVTDVSGNWVKTYWLDAETLYEVENLERRDRDGQPVELRVLLSDFRTVDGVVVSYKSETYRNGALYNTIQVDTIRTNIGVLNSAFATPTLAPVRVEADQ